MSRLLLLVRMFAVVRLGLRKPAAGLPPPYCMQSH